jgi:hypothetical protein
MGKNNQTTAVFLFLVALLVLQLYLRLKYISMDNPRLLSCAHRAHKSGRDPTTVLRVLPMDQFEEALALVRSGKEVCIITDVNTSPAIYVLNRLKCAYHAIPYGDSATFSRAFCTHN